MPKCKDCGTIYRNMDHSVYDCAQAGGKEAQAMMGPRPYCGRCEGTGETPISDPASGRIRATIICRDCKGSGDSRRPNAERELTANVKR